MQTFDRGQIEQNLVRCPDPVAAEAARAIPATAFSAPVWYTKTRSPFAISRMFLRATGFRTPSHTPLPFACRSAKEYSDGSVLNRKPLTAGEATRGRAGGASARIHPDLGAPRALP